MARFTLAIECDNAAFGETPEERAGEIRRLMEHAATAVAYLSPSENTSHAIHDLNGNRVGAWHFEGETCRLGSFLGAPLCVEGPPGDVCAEAGRCLRSRAMSRATQLERNGRRCAGPECGRLYEGPEPYCAECRRQVYAAHIGPDGPYFVAEVGDEWPHELPHSPQCPSCGSPQGFELRDIAHARPHEYACRACGAGYEIGRAPTARVVF